MPIDPPLMKVGLHQPALTWLHALPDYKDYGYLRVFDMGGTKNVTMNHYIGKLPDYNGVLHECWFKEIPDRLYQLPGNWALLTKLEFEDGTLGPNGPNKFIAGATVWNPWQQLQAPYELPTGHRYYEHQGGTYFDKLNEVGWYWSELFIPPPPPAPMPAPVMGDKLYDLASNDGSELEGWVLWTQNPNGSINFRAELIWLCENQTFCRFKFRVPHAAQGKSFVALGYSSYQNLNGNVAPTGDPLYSELTTTAWNWDHTIAGFTFEANSIP